MSQRRLGHTQTHAHTISLSKLRGQHQPTGGPPQERKLKAAEAEAELRNTVRRGRRKRADQIGKNKTTQRKLERLTIWRSFGHK